MSPTTVTVLKYRRYVGHAYKKERGKGKRQNVDSILVEELSGKMDTQRKEKQMGQYYNESLGHQYGKWVGGPSESTCCEKTE